jgi:lipopolysaccharide export system ATP-binding protein
VTSPISPALARLVDRLAHGDRSTTLALHAIITAADDSGAATIDRIAEVYREDHLADLRAAGKDAEREAGRLSQDEVRHHLQTVFPRLAEDGVVTLSGDLLTPDSRVQVTGALWQEIGTARAELAEVIRHTGEHPSLRVPPTPAGGVAVAPGEPPRGPHGSRLEAKGLTKVYKRRKVVNDVALELQQGEIVGLLGPNGAGKTTTFYMIVGLIQPLIGRIVLDGQDITSMPMYRRARRGVGYLSQEPSIFRKLTVEENILAILETLPLTGAQRRERLESLLRELSIEHLRKSKAYQLSGGERRRLEITRALVTQPKFMMLDEPFAGVDPIAVHDIQSIVASLRHRGIGVLISDHNVEQTLDIVDRAYIMFEGQVKVAGTVRELVLDEEVARIYLGPTLAARLRERFASEEGQELS